MRSRQEILATLSVAMRFNTSGVQELGHPQSVNNREGPGPGGGPGGGPKDGPLLGPLVGPPVGPEVGPEVGPPVDGLGGGHAPQVKLSSAFSRTFLNGSTHSVAKVCEAASV
jgi:hypothetical protein